MDLNLGGKKAVVCGSTQGIGKATAIELALLGANVTLVARNEEKLKGALSELSTDAGQKHDYMVADFNVPDDLSQKIHRYADANAVHILINNTGGPPAGPAIEAMPEEFVRAFSNHLLCNQIMVQAFVPGMKRAGYGRIVNVISTSVKIPIRGLGVSNTIRGAVASWAKTLSLELGQFGITVNNVLPGATMTSRHEMVMSEASKKSGKTVEQVKDEMLSQIPAGRFGDSRETGGVIAFLCTPAAAYINGINVPVDGGRTGSL
jgi:3-oxoacyl-[acyl-carrier protein] reductase